MVEKKPKEKKKRKLRHRQELFCKLYASDREFFGNGVQSYAEAYNIDLLKKGAYGVAKVNASRLLTNANILDRINELMDIVVNDIIVDKELAFTIIQKDNLHAKVAAIKEYNLLKERIKQRGTKISVLTNVQVVTQQERKVINSLEKLSPTRRERIFKVLDGLAREPHKGDKKQI